VSFDGQTWAWKQECPTPNSRLVLLYLAMRADDETGYCYPGQKTIARECSLSERTVRDAMAALENMGLIVRKARYNSRVRTSDDIWVQFTETTIFAGRAAGSAATEFPPDLPSAPDAGPKRQKLRSSPATVAGQEPVREPIRVNHSSLRSESPIDDDLAAPGYGDEPEDDDEGPDSRVVIDDMPPFDRFWAAYPRHTSKGTARAAWPKALKKCDAEKIIIAAGDYAEAVACWPETERSRYVPHASTWLNQERWDDDMHEVRSQHGGAQLGKAGQNLKMINNVMRQLNDEG
jgi:hypothetical protein